jgi:pimeloyl-ACP methyl ester carboxylesterase
LLKSYLDYPIEIVEKNPKGKRLILLLHGFGASTFSWRTVMEELSKLGHVIAYDRPGFGFTPMVDRSRDGDPYSLAGQVKLLAEIISQEAKGRPVVVMGHSAGALIATEFALQNPGKVAALVLESPAIWRQPPRTPIISGLLRSQAVEGFADGILRSFEKLGMQILRDSVFNQATLTDDMIAGYRAPLTRSDWRVNLWRFTTADHRNKVRENLWRIDFPVQVISGDHDRIVKVEDTFKVTERIPGHTIYLVPNTGHLAHEEDPEDFLRVVKRFIETRVEV